MQPFPPSPSPAATRRPLLLQHLIALGVAILFSFTPLWIPLWIPERADAAQPGGVVICTNLNPLHLSCRQANAQTLPPNQVIWLPLVGTATIAPPSIGITSGVQRLTLAGARDVNGTGKNNGNILVGNTGSNRLSNAGSGTYVVGNSTQATITSLPNCTTTPTQDCLNASLSGSTSENDNVLLDASPARSSVYIDRRLEVNECLKGLFRWNSTTLKFVQDSQTYGQQKVDASGNWANGTGCTIN
jgi:hypothetical protein